MNSDTLDYGPLQALVGRWQGGDGMDVAPEPDGDDHSPYYETIIFEAAGDVDNADTQELNIVRYHQVVSRKSNDKVFHNESGYLTWEPEQSALMLSFTIPRGVAVVAQGQVHYEGETTVLSFKSVADTEWGISQSPFMSSHARTRQFTREMRVTGNELHYTQTTEVAIYDRIAEHTDSNTLTRAD